MEQKLIFLDIDGTLLPPGDMLVPESTLQSLYRAKANGHKLFLCTGRNYRMTEPLLRHNCFAGAVCSAGGYVLVGVASFTAAAVLTVVCMRLHEREKREKNNETDKEGNAS